MNYQNMPARQLRKVAPQIGLTGASRKTKDEIVAWIDQNVATLTAEQRALVGATDPGGTVVEEKRRRPRNVVRDSVVEVRRSDEPPAHAPTTTYHPGQDMSERDRKSRAALPRLLRRKSITTFRPLSNAPVQQIMRNLPKHARRAGAMVPLVLSGPRANTSFVRGYESGGDRRARRQAAKGAA